MNGQTPKRPIGVPHLHGMRCTCESGCDALTGRARSTRTTSSMCGRARRAASSPSCATPPARRSAAAPRRAPQLPLTAHPDNIMRVTTSRCYVAAPRRAHQLLPICLELRAVAVVLDAARLPQDRSTKARPSPSARDSPCCPSPLCATPHACCSAAAPRLGFLSVIPNNPPRPK